MDALSVVNNASGNAARLLWTDYKDGTYAVGTPAQSGVNYFYVASITGADSRGNDTNTLKTAIGSSSLTRRYEFTIVTPTDVVANDITDLNAVYSYSLAAADAPKGMAKGNKLSMSQLKRSSAEWSGSRPQFNDNIIISDYSTVKLREFFACFCVKIPSNMLDVLAGNAGGVGWAELWGAKTHSVSASSDGRFSVQAYRELGRSDGHFIFKFDRFVGPSQTVSEQWTLESANGTLLENKWYWIGFYINRPGDITDILGGKAQVLIVNLTDNTVVLSSQQSGGVFWGESGYDIGKIQKDQVYSGGFPSSGTFDLQYSGFELWNRPPIKLV